MDHAKKTADRIRPILQAMERSIDSARRRRVHGEAISSAPAPAQPIGTEPAPHAPAPYPLHPQTQSQPRFGQNPPPSSPDQSPAPPAPPRLKARPKRTTAFNDDPFNQTYRPKAG